ncbi:MAG: hypothetical protein ACTSRS_02220 [Candidatus Helarchaeota archaeon]
MEDLTLYELNSLKNYLFRLLTETSPSLIILPIPYKLLNALHSYLASYYEFLIYRLASFLFNRHNMEVPNRQITFSQYWGRQLLKSSYWKWYHHQITEVGRILTAIETHLRKDADLYPFPKHLLAEIHVLLAKFFSLLKNQESPILSVF